MRSISIGTLAVLTTLSTAASAQIALPLDTPITVANGEAVCTGVGVDSRQDPRWNAYPLKAVVAGRGGQYLGDVDVTIAQKNTTIATVHCGGPWLLLRLPAGAYRLTGDIGGMTASVDVQIPATGQGRVILRFPTLGGAISAQHTPSPD